MKMKKRFYLMLWMPLYAAFSRQPAQAIPVDDAEGRRPIAVSLQAAPVEKGLFQFAAKSGFNFLIDSTHIPAQSVKTTGDFNGMFISALGDFMQRDKLACLRQDKSTFLFWQEADPQEVVRAVADGKAYKTEPKPVYIGALSNLFHKYLERDPRAKKILFAPFRITDLPQELQQPVASVVLDYFLDQWPRRHAHNWLQDESWQKARVRLLVPEPGKAGNRCLRLRSVFDAPATAQVGGEKPPATLPYGVAAPGKEVSEELTGSLPYGSALDEVYPPEQVSPQDQVPPATSGEALALLSSPLPTLDASNGDKMNAPITLTIERKTLRSALDEVEKQSGLRLSTAQAPALDVLLLSAHAEKMPLFQLMNGLSRLYGMAWKKVEGGWSADASKRTDIAVLGLRVGDASLYRFDDTYKQGWQEERQNTEDIIDRLLEVGDSRALLSEPGIAFTSLPEELQREIREQVRARATLGRAKQLGIQQKLINEGLTLQFHPRGRSMYMFLADRKFEPIIFGLSILGPDPQMPPGWIPPNPAPSRAQQALAGQQP